MNQLMSVTELAEYLKVNKQTIYNWVNKKEIPFTKIGDLLRFDKDEIVNCNGKLTQVVIQF